MHLHYLNQKNLQGKETNRTVKDGAHVYYMQHNDGNFKVGNQSYYQGNSYASFFGDRTNPSIFNEVGEQNTIYKGRTSYGIPTQSNTPSMWDYFTKKH